MGVLLPVDLPKDEREIPLDLTTGVSSVEVGRIHSEFNARVAHAVTEAGKIESRLIELKRTAKLLRARFTLRHAADKKYELDAAMTRDKDIRKVEDEIAERESMLKMMDAVIVAYTKIVEGASREISRRENERTSRGD